MIRPGQMVLGLMLLTTAMTNAAEAQGVQWLTNPSEAFQQASASGRPILIKFTADWCGYCKKMEQTTFSDPATATVVHRDFIPLLIDADKHPAMAKEMKIKGLPAVLIVSPDMTVLERIIGYHTTKKLLPKLNAVTVARRPAARVPALPAAQKRTASAQTGNTNPFEIRRPATPSRTTSTTTVMRNTGLGSAPGIQPRPSFNGLCLTSVIDERKIIPGSDAFSAEYRGQLLRFRDAAQRDQFFRNPDKYWPMLDGICAMTFLETGKQVPGQLRYAAVFRDRIWVFQTQEYLTRFIESPGDHAARVEEHQKQMKTGSRSY